MEGMRIGRRVYIDRNAFLMDGKLMSLGDDAIVCAGAGVVGHDLTVGCHVMLRGHCSVPSAGRVGEDARFGAGVTMTAQDMPPLYSTISHETL